MARLLLRGLSVWRMAEPARLPAGAKTPPRGLVLTLDVRGLGGLVEVVLQVELRRFLEPENAAPGPARLAAGPPSAGLGTRRAAAAASCSQEGPPQVGLPADRAFLIAAAAGALQAPTPHAAGGGQVRLPGSSWVRQEELPPTGACPAQEAACTARAPWERMADGAPTLAGAQGLHPACCVPAPWGSTGPGPQAEARNTFSRMGSLTRPPPEAEGESHRTGPLVARQAGTQGGALTRAQSHRPRPQK